MRLLYLAPVIASISVKYNGKAKVSFVTPAIKNEWGYTNDNMPIEKIEITRVNPSFLNNTYSNISPKELTKGINKAIMCNGEEPISTEATEEKIIIPGQ
jgi:hypothetical protein